ncbi:hypothetical protein NHX12_023499 [Muraenolepis orangiensis]|uniref:Sodium-dependent lysophosphatidylcholine symporter 1 n=1 Tax=Muraenolepis orangiensis TaxID=630683 RepID=A0A9Q0EN84_9TELE|nr:hypothetical protein NHX12_023499 [Muraenolepis orangiensis]
MVKGEGAEQYTNSLLDQPGGAVGVKPVRKKNERVNQLSVCNKLCYAVGGAPYQITGCALGFFLQIYLLDVAQLDPFYASIILFVGRAWDAVTDPTVGFLVSRSPWTRFGRMLPWILLSTPLAVICYFLIWYVPPFEDGKVIWYLVFYCLFQSLQTCFHVPYSALTMFISTDQKERDSATAYRMTVEVLGTVIGTAIQGQIVGMANAPCIPVHNGVPAELGSNFTAFPTAESNSTERVISLDDTKAAYMIASGIICGIYVLCAIVLFFGVREKKESCRPRSEPMSFFQGMRLVMGYGPYAKLVMGFLFTSLAFMLLEGNFALFCSSTLGFRNDFQNILLVIMLSATLAIPFWQWFLTRFGKKTAVYFGTSSVVPFMILVVCLKSSLVVSYIVSFAAGVGVQNPDSVGHEAIFYSFYVFFTKFASGISLGISTLSLDFAGYITRGCSQPDSVHMTLKLLVSAAPIALILVGLLIFRSYPIDEQRRQGNRKLLQEQRDIEAESETELSNIT